MLKIKAHIGGSMPEKLVNYKKISQTQIYNFPN